MVYVQHDTLYVIATERDSTLAMLLEEVQRQGDALWAMSMLILVASASVVVVGGLILWAHIAGRIGQWWTWR